MEGDEMKRLMLTLISILLLLPAIVNAPALPCPITGKVIAIPKGAADGLLVRLTHTGKYETKTWEWTTAYGGEINFDVGGDVSCSDGMKFTMKIVDCDEPVCIKTLIFKEPGLRDIIFDLTPIEMTTTTVTTTTIATTTIEECFTSAECYELVDCWEYCEKEYECPQLTITTAIAVIITIIISIGGGLKIYKNKLGEATLQHRHRGIRGYHSMNRRHKNPDYRHRLWKDDPFGCMEDVKEINEGVF